MVNTPFAADALTRIVNVNWGGDSYLVYGVRAARDYAALKISPNTGAVVATLLPVGTTFIEDIAAPNPELGEDPTAILPTVPASGAIDSNGEIYLGYQAVSSNDNPNPPGTHTAVGDPNFGLVKYARDGALSWTAAPPSDEVFGDRLNVSALIAQQSSVYAVSWLGADLPGRTITLSKWSDAGGQLWSRDLNLATAIVGGNGNNVVTVMDGGVLTGVTADGSALYSTGSGSLQKALSRRRASLVTASQDAASELSSINPVTGAVLWRQSITNQCIGCDVSIDGTAVFAIGDASGWRVDAYDPAGRFVRSFRIADADHFIIFAGAAGKTVGFVIGRVDDGELGPIFSYEFAAFDRVTGAQAFSIPWGEWSPEFAYYPSFQGTGYISGATRG